MATFRTMTLEEFSRMVNGGTEVNRMRVNLAGLEVDIKKKRKIFNVNGRLTYQTDSGTTAFVLRGDVLYLKNGDTVEVV